MAIRRHAVIHIPPTVLTAPPFVARYDDHRRVGEPAPWHRLVRVNVQTIAGLEMNGQRSLRAAVPPPECIPSMSHQDTLIPLRPKIVQPNALWYSTFAVTVRPTSFFRLRSAWYARADEPVSQ